MNIPIQVNVYWQNIANHYTVQQNMKT